MTAYIIDGVLRAEADAVVHVSDRGFLFGDAVFEVMRVYGGVPFALDEHLERLERSCRAMLIAPAPRPTLEAEVRAAIAALGSPDCYVRVIITRGRSAFSIDPRRAGEPSRVVIAAPRLPLPEGLLERGAELTTVRIGRATDHTRAAGAKVAAYVGNMLALMSAHERGGYEAAMVGEGGEISEGATSNLFVIERGALATPPVSMGILDGITRTIVLRAARDLGVPARERVLFACDFERAEEAFLTSSVREIVPVVRIDGVAIGGGAPGPITERLRARYREIVRERTEARHGSGVQDGTGDER